MYDDLPESLLKQIKKADAEHKDTISVSTQNLLPPTWLKDMISIKKNETWIGNRNGRLSDDGHGDHGVFFEAHVSVPLSAGWEETQESD
jgi:hypothetical protein